MEQISSRDPAPFQELKILSRTRGRAIANPLPEISCMGPKSLVATAVKSSRDVLYEIGNSSGPDATYGAIPNWPINQSKA